MKLSKMTSVDFNSYFFLTICLLCSIGKMSQAGTIAPSTSTNRNIFAADLFEKIALENPSKNVIFSPASIQSCVALAFFGAEGQTAEEMRIGLKLGDGDRDDLAKNYGDFIQTAFKSSNDDNDVQLRMANRIYVNQGLEIKPAFNNIVTKYFQSSAERINFSDSANAVKKINTWVEEQTQNKIKDMLEPGAVGEDTSSVLVNAIYFKAKWQVPFSMDVTHKADFAVNGESKVLVDFMHMDERVRYADIPELDATALELAYKNSDLTMLFILPNKIDGLKDLEKKIAGRDLNEISSKLSSASVLIFIPKFRIEFEVDLQKPLKDLGMKKMFSDNADFSGLFETSVPQKVSDVKHKAFIDVNEAGSEAAAATFLKIVPMSLNLNQKTFRADHPFVFAIRSSSAVYFAGHVTEL